MPNANYTTATTCDLSPVCVGDRVRLLPPHRHAGQVGVYVGYASWQRMWGARVRLEDGTEVPVWRNVEWERVDEESRGSPQGT